MDTPVRPVRCQTPCESYERRTEGNMDFNKLTIKARKPSPPRRNLRAGAATPRSRPTTCCSRCSTRSSSPTGAQLRAEAERKIDALPTVQGGQQQPNVSAAFVARARPGRRRAAQARGRLRLDRAPVPRDRAGAARRDRRLDQEGPRRAARHVAGSRRAATRRSRSSAATSPRRPRRASSTR